MRCQDWCHTFPWSQGKVSNNGGGPGIQYSRYTGCRTFATEAPSRRTGYIAHGSPHIQQISEMRGVIWTTESVVKELKTILDNKMTPVWCNVRLVGHTWVGDIIEAEGFLIGPDIP